MLKETCLKLYVICLINDYNKWQQRKNEYLFQRYTQASREDIVSKRNTENWQLVKKNCYNSL